MLLVQVKTDRSLINNTALFKKGLVLFTVTFSEYQHGFIPPVISVC